MLSQQVSALAKACFESQSCNRSLSRTAGRKKQQKWENDNLFGLNMFMKKVDALNKQRFDSDEELDDESGARATSQGLSFNWQSLFSTLTNGDNDDALETYLKCSNSYRSSGAGESKCMRDCLSEWDRAEFCWLKVERRLRSILVRALVGVEAQQFVAAVETLLLCLEGGGGREVAPLSPSVSHLFACPPRLVQPRGADSLLSRDGQRGEEAEAVLVSVAAPHLVVTLVDSAFHRLLLHATCQFHHVHSKSFVDKKHGGGVRATRIAPFQHSQQGQCRHSISLVPFVLLKKSAGNEGAEEHKRKGKRSGKGGEGKNKENTPANNSASATSSSREQDSGIALDDLTLEEAPLITPGGEAVMVGEHREELEVELEVEHEQKEDESEEDEDEDEEYCLVGLAGASTSRSNPMERREWS